MDRIRITSQTQIPKHNHFQVIIFEVKMVSGNYHNVVTNIYVFEKKEDLIEFLKELEYDNSKKQYIVQESVPLNVKINLNIELEKYE